MTKLQTIRLALVVAIAGPALAIIIGIATAFRRLCGSTSTHPESCDV